MICVMMEEDFVSYDLAVMLRDKGFNEPCMTLYNVYGALEVEFGYSDGSPLRNCDSDVSQFIGDRCDDDSFVFVTAPTYGHVMKWLRVVHKIDICAFPVEYDYITSGYSCCIYKDKKSVVSSEEFKSYEKAVETSIEYCLKFLIL